MMCNTNETQRHNITVPAKIREVKPIGVNQFIRKII